MNDTLAVIKYMEPSRELRDSDSWRVQQKSSD